MDIEEVLGDIMQGMTLRQVETKYEIDRKTLKAKCLEYLKRSPNRLEEFGQTLKEHKKNSRQVEVSDTVIKDICEKVCERRDTIRNIAGAMQIDERTLREKISIFLNKEENDELLKRYIEYQSTIHILTLEH